MCHPLFSPPGLKGKDHGRVGRILAAVKVRSLGAGGRIHGLDETSNAGAAYAGLENDAGKGAANADVTVIRGHGEWVEREISAQRQNLLLAHDDETAIGRDDVL